MSRTRDTLHSITPEQWPELRDMFKSGWPRNEVPYNTIQNYIKWVKIDPRIKQLEVLSLNDSWRENGTYIIIDRYYMFFHTLEESMDSLRRALRLLDWDYSYRISQVHESCQPALDEVIQLFAIELQLYNQTVLYKMTKEESLNLELVLPDGLHLKKLEPKHASIANDVWFNRCEGSEYTLRRLAAWNPSTGLFNASDELLAWCMCWSTGAIAALQVAKEHLRKGYGSIVVKAIAKEMAKVGMNCYASVHCKNLISNLLFKKLGFVPIGSYCVAQTRAKKLAEYGH
ncbi:uncharacterized protein LOC135703015 [Ochlerotatus camptorhynchus]|uniref:uncharacterized protein LOC135703015 n=1 Tax=Ochlerotatus camptorhynchus TaxID=644619 RepID=UPI0031D18D81